MDSFPTFMNIFEVAYKEKDSNALTDILKDARKYFQNISRDDSELVLSTLLDKNKGLLHFLKTELSRSISHKGFDMAVKEGFHLLEFVMEQFSPMFVPHIIAAKETCQLALTTRTTTYVQKAACSAFNKLIELFKDFNMRLEETVETFVSLFQRLNVKERSLIFCVLGTISKHNPKNANIQRCSNRIFQQLRNDFKKQYKPQADAQAPELDIYFGVFANIFDELLDEVKTKQTCQELYEWIKDLSREEKYQSKKVIMRSAIDLLIQHIRAFREFVYHDYKFWYQLFSNLASDKNISNKECGQRALKRFYQEIGCILKDKPSDEYKAMFLHFKNLLEEQLKDNSQIHSNLARHSIYGFSQLAAPCKIYFTEKDVEDMFSLIAHCSLPLCYREDLRQDELESICDYQEALSEITSHTATLSLNQVQVLTKLSILLVKRFPDLPITSQTHVVSSLINTICSIGSTNKDLFEEFLYNLIHDGITWSCSHTLLVDAELQRALNSLPERPVCYKNYLPLWSQILRVKRYGPQTSMYIVQGVADILINTFIILIDKLNLKTRMKEDCIFSDIAFSQIAENEADFRIFVNIADLYVDIFNKSEHFLILNTLHKFLLKVISMSYKHPFVSGFYKMIRTCFKQMSNIQEEEIGVETFDVLHKYLTNTLDLITSFSGELLNTCLYLILDIPKIYVERILNRTIPAFKLSFTKGLNDLELANTALSTLEKWASFLERERMKEFFQELLPSLDPYLHSKESSIDISEAIIKSERKVIKRIVLIDTGETLESMQRRLLLFIASLDADITIDHVYKRSIETGGTWDKKDLLKYTLPLPNAHIDVNFDKILPRLIALAQSSGDRRTKVIASETLYSIGIFIIGKTTQSLSTNPERFTNVYMIMCPALLNLGCDSDEVVWKIFQPLMLQLTHWLSSRIMLRSSATVCLLDSLFQGLSNDSNSSLREFSGMCLAEFTKWSVKQCDDNLTRVNIDAVIYKMMNFAVHPSKDKRMAAAIAFNHLHNILCEDNMIVSTYWLEFLYCFVRSLQGYNNPAIKNALHHVERVLISKQDLLNTKCQGRRKPHGFEGITLSDAANWLFIQCGCLDEHCRMKCMNLFTAISKYVPECYSARNVIQTYVNVHGVGALNLIISSNLKERMETLSFGSLLPLLKSFNCYVWLVRENLIDMEYLFTNLNDKKEEIFNCAMNFVHLVNNVKIEKKDEEIAMLFNDSEELQILQCKVIMSMLDFLETLFNLEANVIPTFFLNTDLFEFISKCIMDPKSLGFQAKNLEIFEALPSVIQRLLETMMRKLNGSFLNAFKMQLMKYTNKYVHDYLDLNQITNKTTCADLKQYIKGLIVLENCNLHESLLQQREEKVITIFHILSERRIGEHISVTPQPLIMDYLQNLLKLLLAHYEPSMTKALVNLIKSDVMLGADARQIAHGVHFLNIFKDIIFRYMLKDIKESLQILYDLSQENPSLLLTVAENFLLFIQRHKKELSDFKESIANDIIKMFTTFERAANNLFNGKQKLINVYGMAVNLKHDPTEVRSVNEAFYTWILNQLTEHSDIEYKVCILQNFLVCLTNVTSTSNPEIIAILQLSICANNLSEQNINALKVTNCFQTLLTLLPVTKSLVFFEFLILFGMGIGKKLHNEKFDEYLKKYCSSIPDENVLKSIEIIYKLFFELNRRADERFDILHSFFLPMFQYSKTAVIQQFFENNIKQIYNMIQQTIVGCSSNVEQIIVSKIGCYELVATMFAKVHIANIDNIDSNITRNAIGNVKTGRELIQELYNNTLQVRKLRTMNTEHKELMRLLHCSAYNCSIAIVCLKEDEDSYLTIFAEDKRKQQLIWENIIDCSKECNLQQTFKEYPKNVRKLINIRKTLKHKQVVSSHYHTRSYDLSTSTLNEDINAYDFNEMTIRNIPENTEKTESMSLTFEYDDFNNHECMASICGALTHMISQNTLNVNADVVTPKWLMCFCSSITSTTFNNVRLFMLKMILNMQYVFKIYATFLLPIIMRVTHAYLKTNQFNYIITDVLIMLIDWHDVAVPVGKKDRVIAQSLWELIIHKVIVQNTKDTPTPIYKYNMNIMRTMLETWQSCLKLPQNLNDKIITAPAPAVYLVLVCLTGALKEEIAQKQDVVEFLLKTLEKWQNKEEIVLQSCECLGLILSHFDSDEKCAQRKCEITERIGNILREMQTKFVSRQIKCIRAISKNYVAAAMDYFEYATLNMSKVDTMGKVNCLEIFLLCIPNLSAEQITKELGYMQFHNILKNKLATCDKIALKIVDAVVSVLPPSNLLELINFVIPYTKHNSSEYRESSYNIFISIYKTYSGDTSTNEDVKMLMNHSKKTLIIGLFDPAEDLNEKLSKFWTQDAQLKDDIEGRFLDILSMYDPKTSNIYLPFMLLMMLDLCTKSKEYTQNIFESSQDCAYTDYEIASSWRIKNLGSVVPLFAPSLANEMNQTFSQTVLNTPFDFSYARSSRNSSVNPQSSTTQDFEFEETFYNEESSLQDNQDDDVFKVPNIPEPVQSKKSRRFLSNSSHVTSSMSQKEIKKNIRRTEMIKEEVIRQQSSVKLYRKYRLGDFPDIEVSNSNLITPLQQLSKMDQVICKDLIVSIVCSLLKAENPRNFVAKVAECFKHVIEIPEGNNFFISAILEILLATHIRNYPAELITKISRSNGLHFHGSLIIEEGLIYSAEDAEPPTKKPRSDTITDSHNEWLQLTHLYESMSDVDGVLSILKNHVSDQDMQVASSAQAANNWLQAKAVYEKMFKMEENLIQEHCLHGLFQCLSNLSCWGEIDKYIQRKLNNDLNNIWNDPWKDWLFPWLFDVNVRKIFENDTSESYMKIIQSWLDNEEKLNHIKPSFGEQLTTFFIPEKVEVARDFLINDLDEIRGQWIGLHPLSTQLRIRKLNKLRIINDITVFLKSLQSMHVSSDLQSLLTFWGSNLPSKQDDVLLWDKIMSYRIHFTSLLNDKISQWEECSTQESTINTAYNAEQRRLQINAFNMQLKVIETSLNQKNKFIAQKYLRRIEQQMDDCPNDLRHQFLLNVAKTKYVSAELETDVQKKMTYYNSAWKYAHDLLQESDLDHMTHVNVRQHISKMASAMITLSKEDNAFAGILSANSIILNEINAENNDVDEVIKSLQVYSLNQLKTCCNGLSNLRDSYCTLSKYCYARILESTDNSDLHKDLINSTLKGMQFGSLETAHYFPCLLKSEYFDDAEARDIFARESEGVQTWMYLSWQAQLFSHVGTSISSLVIPILERIVETYPNAAIYTSRLTLETNSALLNNPETYKIRQILNEKSEVNDFMKAMHYVVQPELYLLYYIREFLKSLSLGVATMIDMLLRKVYPDWLDNEQGPRKGRIYNEIAGYKNKIKELERKDPEEVKRKLMQLMETIQKSFNNRKDRVQLKDYCPWLEEFNGNGTLEIPGQYLGNKKPLPEYHSKIMKIESTVKVMQSIRKPIRVTMIGNDAKEYNFLVKFGEDLRLDQRLQQLFTIMNGILHNNATCRNRRLSIDTYQVIPLSKTLGLIQWMENTRSLKELVYFTLSKRQMMQYDSVSKEYYAWIRRAAPSKKIPEQYKEALSKYTASCVITKMAEYSSKTEWDGLRNTFKILCPSLEGFVTLRRNFVCSYAVMCIAHWILGIGDRHPGNTLVTIESGRSLGIDFGLAFGAGIDLKVPELMPFRLTSQILGLLKPFGEKDLLCTIMTYVLRALKNDQGLILACMDVFVHEPLDWAEHVNKTSNDNENNMTDVKWLPKKKIDVVSKKLNGVKPSKITLEQLKEQHYDKYFDKYYAVVTGDDEIKRSRARLKDEHLTPEEQVECLLDEATDLNILGRSFVGWQPWL